VYELIIVGAGPAGITAAVYAARNKMDFLVITTNIGGQVTLSSKVENYTGFQYITGEDLSDKFQKHLDSFKFDLKMENVKKVERDKGFFEVKTDNATYQGKTVIIATGRRPRELKVPGEEELKYRGVAYCATCDAPLFTGRDVAVVGGGDAGLEAVLQLMKIAKSIRLIELKPKLSADKKLIEKACASDKVEIWTNTKVMEILGHKVVEGIKIRKNGVEELLSVQGVFVEVGSTPNSDVVDFVKTTRFGEIYVNCGCETNVPGLFAAGDVTNVPAKQIVVAAGEGCKAVLSAFRYVNQG
jgi:alkyl hydroperoxide reductase subunit F